jgi:hypothetical protein
MSDEKTQPEETTAEAPAKVAPAADTKPEPRALSDGAVAAGRQTIEHWAGKKGMLDLQETLPPRVIKNARPGSGPLPVSLRASGIRMPRVNPKHADFLGTKIALGWPDGHELTEAEFDEAVAKHGPAAVVCH